MNRVERRRVVIFSDIKRIIRQPVVKTVTATKTWATRRRRNGLHST